MGMGINVNSIRGVTNRYLATQQEKGRQSFEKLASGLRIAKGSDDASGLGISERMRSQIRSFDVASRNTMDGISMAKTAEGALSEASSTLGKMKELAVQAASGTLSDSDKTMLQEQFEDMADHLDFLGSSTEFNGQSLLDGSSSEIRVQTGTDSGQTTSVNLAELSNDALGLDGVDLTDRSGANAALDAINQALEDVSNAEGELGASVNTLGSEHRSLSQSSVQLSSTESRIRDVDIAYETAVAAKSQILAAGSISLLTHSALHSTSAQSLL